MKRLLLALLALCCAWQTADAADRRLSRDQVEAIRSANCPANGPSTVQVPANKNVYFVLARYRAEASYFVFDYRNKVIGGGNWLTDGPPFGVWPPQDSVFRTYPQQTVGAFNKPNVIEVRPIGMWNWGRQRPTSDIPPAVRFGTRALYCMDHVSRTDAADRVVLGYYTGRNDPDPDTIVQVIFTDNPIRLPRRPRHRHR
jgi:hypothetical protein